MLPPASVNAPSTVLATWLLGVLALFEARGVPLAKLGDLGWVREAGERNPTRPLQLVAVRRLWHRAMQWVDDPGFGLQVGLELPLQAMNVIAWLVAHSPSAREGLSAAIRFQSLVSNSGRFEMSERGDDIVLRYHVKPAPVSMHPAQIDSAIAGLLGLLQRCSSPPLRPLAAALPGVSAATRERYAAVLKCPVRFAACPSLLLSSAEMARPMPGADPVLLQLAWQRATDMLRSQNSADNLVEHVRSSILARGAAQASCSAAAHDLGLSTRTLQRRLAANGTGFRQLLEATRMEEAVRLLGETGLPLAGIAEQVGYADATAFSHAVRAHWGTSPRLLRGELRGEAGLESERTRSASSDRHFMPFKATARIG